MKHVVIYGHEVFDCDRRRESYTWRGSVGPGAIQNSPEEMLRARSLILPMI